jgi:hypothetical protein
MCTVSVVYDYGRNINLNDWDKESYKQFKKLVEAAKEFDVATSQPDCEDYEKTKWVEIVEIKIEGQH